MKDINGYVNDIECDRLTAIIGLDTLDDVSDYSEGDKVKVVFEYELTSEETGELQFEEKEMIGEIITIYNETNCIDVKFEEEVPKQLNDYDNVEVTKWE